ncbi:serine/threonine protein kinase, partial [Myxococcota bacterium]|nr:serine/threonine protein kinase [Myxococcota bacterium]
MNPEHSEVSFVGQTLAERYRVDAKIGQGTVGTVYRGEDVAEGRPVAIKIFNPDVDPGTPNAQHLLNDAQRANELGHPNLVPSLDAGVHADRYLFIVEPLLDGQSMARRIESAGALDAPLAQRLVGQVLQALEAMHRADLLHLDLKPSNVYLVKDPLGLERAVLGGVGMRHVLLLENATGKAKEPCRARVEYITPESVSGKPGEVRSDIYLVGVLLYEALTGRAPFTGGNFQATAKRHVYEKPLGLKLARPQAQVPEALEALVLRCLNKSAGARYASAADLQRALDKLVAAPVAGTSGPFRALGGLGLSRPPAAAAPASASEAAPAPAASEPAAVQAAPAPEATPSAAPATETVTEPAPVEAAPAPDG